MSELPSDLSRLHAIADWLRQRLSEAETIGAYLRLQAEQVDAAISRLQREDGLPGWRLQPMRTPAGRATLHRGDCWITAGHPVSRDEALLALHEPIIEVCRACRPDRVLGRERPAR